MAFDTAGPGSTPDLTELLRDSWYSPRRMLGEPRYDLPSLPWPPPPPLPPCLDPSSHYPPPFSLYEFERRWPL
jgi:hypothetical protein